MNDEHNSNEDARAIEGEMLDPVQHVMGRPTVFDDEKAAQIISHVKAGIRVDTAAAIVGISKITLQNWLRRGARPNAPPELEQFSLDYRAAFATAEASALLRIRNAGERDWHADAWYLERSRPKYYSKHEQLDINVEFENAARRVAEEFGVPYERLIEQGPDTYKMLRESNT